MPTTFAPASPPGAPAPHPATSRSVPPVTAAALLTAAAAGDASSKTAIVRSSVGGCLGPDKTHFKIAPTSGHGFVDTVLCAYAHHHALVIRPDDVWLALVSQFALYVTAELNRDSCSFLSAGLKPSGFALEISVESDAAQADVAKLSRRMRRLLQKTVPDTDLRDWLLPEFSTTTQTDAMVSCLLVLSGSCAPSSSSSSSTVPAHEYTFDASCGIPRVTLEGERADWELLVTRLEMLKTRYKDFGLPVVAWYHLLHPVLSHFAAAFDDPEGADNREFWGGVIFAKEDLGGKKSDGKLSGWITALCAFSVDGRWLGPELAESATSSDPTTLSPLQFWTTYAPSSLPPAPPPPKATPKAKPKGKAKGKKGPQLQPELDPIAEAAPASSSPRMTIAQADLPSACASASLSLTLALKSRSKSGADANGVVSRTRSTGGTGREGGSAREQPCTVLAGLVGMGFSSSRDTALSETGRNDTVRPVVAWWIYEDRRARARAEVDVVRSNGDGRANGSGREAKETNGRAEREKEAQAQADASCEPEVDAAAPNTNGKVNGKANGKPKGGSKKSADRDNAGERDRDSAAEGRREREDDDATVVPAPAPRVQFDLGNERELDGGMVGGMNGGFTGGAGGFADGGFDRTLSFGPGLGVGAGADAGGWDTPAPEPTFESAPEPEPFYAPAPEPVAEPTPEPVAVPTPPREPTP
ncbi:hypothetical protein C8R47DRAFT_1017605, partial [Mycena vitilis]